MNIQLITPADEVTENLMDNSSGSSEQENKPSKRKRRVFPVVLLILLILAIGLGIYYFYIANKPKGLKDNAFSSCISIDNTFYTGLINDNNTISKIENGQLSEFAALPENYSCDYLLYNENENLFYTLGTKDENDISEYAIFSLNEDGSINQKIFHTSIPPTTKIINYSDFQYVQGNFYALHYDETNAEAQCTIVKITPEGSMEDFYPIKNSSIDYVCDMVANNSTIYCAYANENKEVKLITLENVNGDDLQVSENPFDSNFKYFCNCYDDYFTYYSFVEGKEEPDSVEKVMKYSINDKNTNELLSLNNNKYDIKNVVGDYIFYIQTYEDYNENGISSIPIKLFEYNWETKETTGVLDKVFNPADYGVTEKTTMAWFDVADVSNTGDKILYDLYLSNSSTDNDMYFICNSDGSDDKLLNNRVLTME